jgi:hypothetical protein
MDAVLPTGSIGLTVGRNIGREPLSELDWAEFQARIDQAVASFVEHLPGSFVTVSGNVGEGFWFEDGQRISEDNAVWLIQYQLLFARDEFSEDELEAIAKNQAGAFISLADDVAHIVHAFGQDAFALTEGRTGLIPGHEQEVVDVGGEVEAFLAQLGDDDA